MYVFDVKNLNRLDNPERRKLMEPSETIKNFVLIKTPDK